MTATSHAILGTLIAARIPDPTIAIPLALVSHIIADIIPHWDMAYRDNKGKTKQNIFNDSVIDVTVGFVISYLLLFLLFPQTNLIYAFLMILVAQAPDWIMSPYYFFNIKGFKWAYKLQKLYDHKLKKPWGIINQVVVVLASIVLAKFL